MGDARHDVLAFATANAGSFFCHSVFDPSDASVLPDTATVERPRNPEHGDYATNLALQVAKKAGANPREFGGWLAEKLAEHDAIAEADIAGPGFINIRLAAAAQGEIVAQITLALWCLVETMVRRNWAALLTLPALALGIVRAALACHDGMATFADAGISGP